MKIVVVDDDNIIRKGLCKILNKIDETNEIAGSFQNGKHALEYLENNCQFVDLVITDIKMPVMTGIDLIKYSNEKLKKIPLFIVLSGYDEFDYVRDTMRLGAFNYLLKPINMKELEKIIEEAKIKLKDRNTNNEIYSKSVEILKRDLFKNILFSNKEIINEKHNVLLKNMQFDKNKTYKMMAVNLNNKEDEKIVIEFINKAIENSSLEYCSFHYKSYIYIVFYADEKISIDYIEKECDIFLKNKIEVYIFKTIGEIYKLRQQSQLLTKITEQNKNKINGTNKYFIYDEKRIKEILEEKENSKETAVIKIAKDYIINNYNNNITLKDVADEVYLSQNYFSELFKKEIGEGFYDFLTNYRVKKAKELLLTTNLRVYEIAQKVGYSDSITFGRVFKKVTGSTPNFFRNK